MATRRCGGGDIVVCGPAAGSAGLCRSALGRDRVSPVKRSRPSALLHTTIGMERRWQRMHPNESGQATRAARAISLLWGFAEATVFFVVPDGWISRRALSSWRAARASWSSEEHTSDLPSLIRISYAVFCL